MNKYISDKLLIENYLKIKAFLGHIPSISDMAYHSNYPVSLYLKKYETWHNFLKNMNDLIPLQKNYSDIILDFFKFIEQTKITKSYKMGVLLLIFKKNTEIKKYYSLTEIAVEFKEIYTTTDLSYDLWEKKYIDIANWEISDYEKLILSYPINYLTENNKNSTFFIFKDNSFILSENLYTELKNNTFVVEEIIDRINYRNICYFKQKYNLDFKF